MKFIVALKQNKTKHVFKRILRHDIQINKIPAYGDEVDRVLFYTPQGDTNARVPR